MEQEGISGSLPTDSFTQIRKLIDQLWTIRSTIASLENEKEGLSGLILKTLEALDAERFDATECAVSVVEKSSVKFPTNPEDRKLLFDYLKKRGIFEDMISIHSGSFNNWFNEEEQLATKRGEFDFHVPGVAESKPYKTLSMRKKI